MAVVLPGLLIGCDEEPQAAAAPAGASRFVAVSADPNSGHRPDTFCDAQPKTKLDMPEVEGGTVPTGKPVWLNVWATWCKPCIEEIPLIMGMQRKMRSGGLEVELALVSADASADEVKTYREKHPDVPSSLRFTEPAHMHALFEDVGLDAAAPIPVHMLIGADGNVSCVRSGAVTEEHADVVQGLLAE